MLRIQTAAVLLAVLEFVLSILPLVPRLEWTAGWGKLYYTLAVTDASSAVRTEFSYELMNEGNALMAAGMLFTVLCFVTGLTGTVMFTLSVCISRTAAVLAGTFFSVLPVAVLNMNLYQKQLIWFSPFSWLDLVQLNGKDGAAPSFSMVIIITIVLEAVMCMVSVRCMRTKDVNWVNEE